MDLSIFFDLSRNKFIPIYGDFVALSLTKPQQILIEESNALSHLSQVYNSNLEEGNRLDNLKKAEDHLVRAILDTQKLIWIHLAKHLDLLIFDEKKRLCFNLPENEIINQHKQFLLKGRQARNRELEHLGNDPLEAIDGYEEVIKIGYNLFKQVDQVKVDRFKK